MTELAESIAITTDDPWECPFSHRAVKNKKTNHVPKPDTKNNASVLSKNLNADSKHLTPIDITFTVGATEHEHVAQFSAHHLIPGNESWPKSDLYKWIDKRPGHISGDIGYDVNNAENGVDLPSHTTEKSWSAKGPAFQKAFAYACMEADPGKRQFHDRHPAYSKFVIKVLNKIASKLEINETPGCGKKNCSAGNEKPFAPPFTLVLRLDNVSGRLRKYLRGDETKWQKPLMTSRFALMYHNRQPKPGMTQAQARKELNVNNF